MAPTNTKTARAATLKYVYLDVIRENLRDESALMTGLMQSRKTQAHDSPDGKGWVMDIDYARHGGIGPRKEGAALPNPGARKDVNVTFYEKYYYGKTDFSGPAMNSLASKKASFDGSDGGTAKTLRDLTNDVKKDMNRILWGSGAGYLAMVTSASGAVETVKKSTAANYQYGWGATFGTKHIYPGREIDIVDFAAGTSMTLESQNLAGSIVSAVGDGTVTFTTDPAYAEAEGDWLCAYGAIDDTTVTAPAFNEGFGLWALCNDVDADDCIGLSGTTGVTTGVSVGGLAVASYPFWKGNKVYAGSTTADFDAPVSLTLGDMNKAYVAPIAARSKKKQATAIYTSWGGWSEYGRLLEGDRRYGGKDMKLRGGFTALMYNDIPLFPDSDAPEGMMFFIHEPSFIFFENGEPFWLDKDGSVLHLVDGYDQYVATLAWYYAIGIDDRAAQTILMNFNEW